MLRVTELTNKGSLIKNNYSYQNNSYTERTLESI